MPKIVTPVASPYAPAAASRVVAPMNAMRANLYITVSTAVNRFGFYFGCRALRGGRMGERSVTHHWGVG